MKHNGDKCRQNLFQFQSAFQQTLGDKFTFQQDNNLKHKAKSPLELFTRETVNVPERPSYSLT